jgi:hypothetical protein
MARYRLYLLQADGHISRGVDLNCETDEQALAVAMREPHPLGRELWDGARLIAMIPGSEVKGSGPEK